jgi:transcriptional regulator
VLIRSWDAPQGDEDWRAFVAANAFGHLVAAGANREVPVVVPTQFLLDGDELLLHLARPNPIWEAIDENPVVVMSVAGDWAYIPSDWKAIGDEDPREGIPTTYYAAVQLIGRARVVDEPGALAAVLRRQLADLQPDTDVVDPAEHRRQLRAIRGLRVPIDEVRAKSKYGANVDDEHRAAVQARLLERDGPGDRAAAAHIARSFDR